MTQPTVRLATIEDLPWIRQLWREMLLEQAPPYPTDIPASIDSFTRSLAMALVQSPPQAFVFLATLPGSEMPDAFLAYEVQTRQLGEPSRLGFVHYCYTRRPARNQGLATTLAELTAEHMTTQGLVCVEITTLPTNEGWADLGFIPFEMRHHALLSAVTEGCHQRRRRLGNGHDADFDVPPPLSEDPGDDR
jgi:hypothetical protein